MGDMDTAASRAAVATVQEFLGGPVADVDGAWRFDFGEHLESNWGAVYGGALAAGVLSVARCAAPEQSPRSLHLQIVRAVPRGSATTRVTVRHAGRTVATVEVDMFDERGKLAVIALVTLVTPSAIAAGFHDTSATAFRERYAPSPLQNVSISSPVSDRLEMTRLRNGVVTTTFVDNIAPNVDGSAASAILVTVPWDSLEVTGPEAACLVADASVGMPVLHSSIPTEVAGPNPDLSMRFTTAPATRLVKSAASMPSIQHGSVTVTLEVHGGDQQLAHGLATSLLIVR